jgi:hypothetical protein
LAIQALTFIAEAPDHLGRFLAVTGIGPAEIRSAAREQGFLTGVLEYLASDERLLTEFASKRQTDPAAVGRALAALGAGPPERDGP